MEVSFQCDLLNFDWWNFLCVCEGVSSRACDSEILDQKGAKWRGYCIKQMSLTVCLSCGHVCITIIIIIITIKTRLLQGLVMCAAALGDPDARTQFWTHVLDPPVTSFKQLMASETFTKQYQQEDLKKQVLYHIDNFIGKKCAGFAYSTYSSFSSFVSFFCFPHHCSTSRI